MNYQKACEIFGNGNIKKGKELIFELAEDLEQARIKHSSEEWEGKGDNWAFKAFMDEVSETLIARNEQNPRKRIRAEIKNVFSVGTRILNNEQA